MEKEGSANTPFQKHEVEEYERKRYRGLDQRLVHARELKILRMFLKKIGKDIKHVLDIPCGYGRFSDLLIEKSAFTVNSDISYHMVRRACERRNKSGKSLVGVVVDAKSQLPFKRDAFDAVLSMRFFHHIHEKKEREDILKEYARVSSEWIICSYYHMNFIHILQRRLRRRIKKSKTRIKMISRKEFEKEAELNELSVVKVYPLIRGVHSQHIALLKKVRTGF